MPDRLAREIHAGLVPPTHGRTRTIEWHGVSHPSGEVGGDLVDVVADATGGWTASVADVSGHGVAAGVLMGMFKAALRSAHRVSRAPADGLIEVFDTRERELGMAALLTIVQAAARREGLAGMAAGIFTACSRYGAQTDDQSLLILRRL